MDTTAPDYAEAVGLVVDKLADVEKRTPDKVLKSLAEAGDDALAFRITAPDADTSALPLAFARSLVEGARQLLMASACTVLKPQAHHPRLSRNEAEKFMDAALFRHTQPGSFVLNVSCPVNALEIEAPLLPGEVDAPFVRRTTWNLNQSLTALVSAIEADTLDKLVEETKKSATPTISANFCEALTLFDDERLKNSLVVSLNWASVIPWPIGITTPTSSTRVQHDYFPRIEEVRRELRKTEEVADDTFVGTVEQLNGLIGPDGRRAGEVILSVLLKESEMVRVRINLNPDQYAVADKAHMTNGSYVKATGRLHPGRQPRLISDIQNFDIIAK